MVFISEYPDSIIVSGSDLSNCTGTYFKCEEKSSAAKIRPVYKLEGKNRYIYFYPNSKGWRIGSKHGLAGDQAGEYFYASKTTYGAFKNYVDHFLPYFDHLPVSG